MSDITERLRTTWPMIDAGPVTTAQRELANEAADEIERLRAALRFILLCTPARNNSYDCGDPFEIARAALGDQP